MIVSGNMFFFSFKMNEISAVPAVCQEPNTAAAVSVPLVHLTHTKKIFLS